MDVTPSSAEVLRSVLSGVGGSTGGWRFCWSAPSLPQFLPATSKNPPPYISLLFLCFCSDGSNQHKIWAAGGNSVERSVEALKGNIKASLKSGLSLLLLILNA